MGLFNALRSHRRLKIRPCAVFAHYRAFSACSNRYILRAAIGNDGKTKHAKGSGMSQRNTDENSLPGVSGEADFEEEPRGEFAPDMQDAAQPVREAEALSEMDFFRKLFFRK